MPAHKFILSALFCAFFCWFFFFSFVWAATSINIGSSPSQVAKLEEFEVAFSVSLDSDSQYYYKGRVGQGSSRNKAETYHNGDWLGDSDAWTKFPNFQTDSSGSFTGKVKLKVKDNCSEGENKLTVRVRKVDTSKNKDSGEVTIEVGGSVGSGTSPSPSPTSQATSYPSGVYLSEFLACPSSGGKEWVEIYNSNNSEVVLTDWLIRDSTNSNKQEFSATLGSKSYFKVELGSGFLNNSGGDTVKLYHADGEIDSVSYDQCSSDYSWAKVGGSWCQTNPSAGQINNNCNTEEAEQGDNNDNEIDDSLSGSLSNQEGNLELSSSGQVISAKTLTRSSPLISLPTLSTPSAEVLGEETESSESGEKKSLLSDFFIPFLFSGLGIVLLGVSFYPKIIKYFPQK